MDFITYKNLGLENKKIMRNFVRESDVNTIDT